MARSKPDIKPSTRKTKSLTPDKLRWHCSEDLFDFKNTHDIKPRSKIIGQDRAIEAIRTGLGIRNPGFNIFVSGLVGTGRSTTVKRILASIDLNNGKLDDKLYVHNFKEPDYPRLIRLKAGLGTEFSKDMDLLLKKFQEILPGMFESDRFKKKVDEVSERFRDRQRDLFKDFEKGANDSGFAVVQIQMGNFTRPDLFPLFENEPVSFDDMDKLVLEKKFPEEKADLLKDKYPKLRSKLDTVLSKGRKIERELHEELGKLIRRFGLPCIETHIDDLRERYQNDKVNEYLDEIRDYTINNIQIFKKKDEPQSPVHPAIQGQGKTADPFRYYQVNLLVNNARCKKPPVIIETSPNFKNLFGTIEKEFEPNGSFTSDFMNIKPGSLLRADGGVLVINLLEAIAEPYVWTTLKRTLKYVQLEIEAPEAVFFGHSALKPEPIKLDLKVVLIGDKQHYIMLYNYDDSFKKIFKICADFTDEMPRNKQNINEYTHFLAGLAQRENLRPFTASGIAAIIEESLRMVGHKEKLSARFSDVADVAREASYWAETMESEVIERLHITRAIDEQKHRRGMIEDKMKEFITSGLIMIDTTGSKDAQINGLAVYNYGEYM
ncbi:AAA family ATPase, partial [bacterium]|nr:AAA family ATPase [candidate division CSSED10-310 bacterium]